MIGLLAVIELGFDPLLNLGPLTIRWQTIGVTVGLLVALTIAALLIPRPTKPNDQKATDLRQPTLEQMLLILVGIVPGAVVGGRIVHVLDFYGAYAQNLVRVIDPTVGSLSLLGAVIGGTLSALYVCRLLRAPADAWAAIATVPLLLALGLGKIAQLLGGAGQGTPFDGGWAVAFVGDGPWVSLAPAVPSHPAQVYEGVWLLVAIAVVLVVGGARSDPSRAHPYVAWADRARFGSLLFVGAIAWFLVGRFLIGFTWRDPQVVGPLNMEQFLALVLLAGGSSFVWLNRERLLRAVALALCLVFLGACGSTTSPPTTVDPTPPTPPTTPLAVTPSPAPSADIVSIVSRMTVDEKIGQLFMVSFYGDTANETDPTQVASNKELIGADNIAEAIARYHLGGVAYFQWAGNLNSAAQIATLSNEIQAVGAAQRSGIPLLVATDQEGGSVVRLPEPATTFAGNMALGATGTPDLARLSAAAMGEELRALGINDVLAPVADVNVNPSNPIIGLRSFGADPAAVAAMTAAAVHGFQGGAGVGATVKHFPGHGDTNVDSHSHLPVIGHSAQEWASVDEPPFAAGIGAGVDSVMVGHLAVPALDASGTPASLSEPIVGGVLRGQLGFDGVVITDALDMGALRDTYGDDAIPVMAVGAGDDILLMPPSLPVAFAAVQDAVRTRKISVARLDESVGRILRLKQQLGLFGAAPLDAGAAAAALGTDAHRAVETSLARASVTLVANDGGALPIKASSEAGPYLVVGTTSPPVAAVAGMIGARGLSVATYLTGPEPRASVAAEAAAKAADYGTVIVLTKDADTDAGQQRVVSALAATGKRLITVSIGRPYDQGHYRAAINACLYSDSDASLRALVRVIFGELSPTGHLPVAIPDPGDPQTPLYPIGFGLSY
jgi:beta-N-acetylhexosaminidase